MAAPGDFNYKVALAEGLKRLQAGRLRQAEEQFRYLAKKFPGAEGGHRGLAKVLIEMEDRPGALAALREGAAALVRANDRDRAIGLLREAVSLDRLDLAAHRHLAAALAVAGKADEAAEEYRRFAEEQLAIGDRSRARIDIRYALETLGPIGPLGQLANRLSVDSSEEEADPRAEALASAVPAPGWEAPPGAEQAWEPPPPAPAFDAAAQPWEPRPASTWKPAAPASSWESPARAPEAPSLTQSWEKAAAPLPAAPSVAPVASAPPAAPAAPRTSAADGSEEQAAALIAAKHPGAADVALRTARAHLAGGRTNAASDLLLQMVASRLAQHDAQRLLIDVAQAAGRREVAREKCVLLAEALRLDGRTELAAEVERLGKAV